MIKMYNSLPMLTLWCNAVTCAVSLRLCRDGLTVMATDDKVWGFHCSGAEWNKFMWQNWFTGESTQENKTVTIHTEWSKGVPVAPSPVPPRFAICDGCGPEGRSAWTNKLWSKYKYKTDHQKKEKGDGGEDELAMLAGLLTIAEAEKNTITLYVS